jgi:MinD superfamily P-loop ATPase
MVHARLGIAEENSGKLVTVVRREARQLAEQRQQELVIVDGPPGIGCPVIASVTGASLVLAVTEPTLSGEHDLERVLRLTEHFGIPTAVCVNKWDLNPCLAEQIEGKARAGGAAIAGRIRYDRDVTTAQIHAQATVERDCQAGNDMRAVWGELKKVGNEYGIRL